jgi:hypothetical protein
MTTRRTRIAAILLTALLLGFQSLPVPAGAEDSEPAPLEAGEANSCGADLQACSAGDSAAWCCPIQASGAYVCCGAMAGVCHACDVDELPDDRQVPVQVPTPADLPHAE